MWCKSLTPSGKIKFRPSVVNNITLSFDTIREAFAPSSMFAIHFILHSIPVYLSTNNPLYRLLGHFVPAMSSSESIDLMMNTIIRSSISRDLLPDAGIYLSSGRL